MVLVAAWCGEEQTRKEQAMSEHNPSFHSRQSAVRPAVRGRESAPLRDRSSRRRRAGRLCWPRRIERLVQHTDGGPGGWHGGGLVPGRAMSPEARARAHRLRDRLDAEQGQRDRRAARAGQGASSRRRCRIWLRRATSTASTATPSWRRLRSRTWTAPTLDELRRAELQLAESASSASSPRWSTSPTCSTPEQRAELVKLAAEFRR